MGNPYPAQFATADGIVRAAGAITFTDGANQPTSASLQVLDARNYGVDFTGGNSGADQSAAIQAALTAAAALTNAGRHGACVQLPLGVGRCDAPLTMSYGTWLRGYGAPLTQLSSTAGWTGGANPLLTLDATTAGARVSDFTLVSTSQVPARTDGIVINTAGALYNTGGDFVIVENMFVWPNGASSNGITCNSLECRIVNNYVRGSVGAGSGYADNGTDNFYWGNTADTCGGAGFSMGTSNTKMFGNKAFGCNGSGFNISGFRNTFVDCEAQDNNGFGFNDNTGGQVFVGCLADTNGQGGGTMYGFSLKGTSIGAGLLATNRAGTKQSYGYRGQVDAFGNKPMLFGMSSAPGIADVDPASVWRFALVNGIPYSNLVTADPHVAGQWWANSGVVTISAG